MNASQDMVKYVVQRQWFTSTPQAVVFDCDGLLVETAPCWVIAEAELFARRGLLFGDQQEELLAGLSIKAMVELMAEFFDEPGNECAIESELTKTVATVIRATATAMPGAQEIVNLISRKVPVAVASNSPRMLLEVALGCVDLSDAFSVTVAADEVVSPKPAPDIYLTACGKLGAQPKGALAFEDSIPGVRAAQAAGIPVVGVPVIPDSSFPADIVIDSLCDPVLIGWVRRW